MRQIKISIAAIAMLFGVLTSLFAQSTQRGYYNAPYARYEAEDGILTGGATVSGPTNNQGDIWFDASDRKAVNLRNGQSVEWTVSSKEANGAFNRMGIVIRYSVAGVTSRDEIRSANVQVYVNDQLRTTLSVDTRYSWEALWQYNDRYGNNTGISNTNWSMRFDEARYRVDQSYPAGTKVRLVSQSNDLWIDFIEVENVPEPKTAAQQGATRSFGGGNGLQSFVDGNGGQTIFVPEGTHTVSRDLWMGAAGTSLVGAGMWYTTIYFDRREYDAGGIHLTNERQNIRDMSLNSNMKDRADGYKGIWGSTRNATIENVWITHFETGAWFAGYGTEGVTANVTIRHCRFRNNYADGINFCKGANNNVAEYCSFRSNCDDDMAIWPANNEQCYNNTYRYCTAENNNRAASIALYGGYGNKWENILIKDGREVAIRVSNMFAGAGFGNSTMNEISNVDIIRCGTTRDHFGNMYAAIDINSCPNNAGQIRNVRLSCIDVKEYSHSSFIACGNNFNNMVYCGITVNGTLQHNNSTSCTCATSDIPVTGVTVNPTSRTISVAETFTIVPTVAPADASNKEVTWSSSNTAIATVNASGVVTGVAVGQATITVRTVDGGFTATCVVTVQNVSVISVSLANASVNLGENITLAPVFNPANATNKNVTYSIVSGGANINLNTTTGVVTGTNVGSAVVRVTTQDGSRTADATITVLPPPACEAPVIVRTTTAPVIDGTKDAVWNSAPAASIANRLYNGTGSNMAGFSAQWKALYDNTNMYILVEVTKPTAYPNFFAPADDEQWWTNSDAIEIYFDGDNSKQNARPGNTDLRAYRFRYNQPVELTSPVIVGDDDIIDNVNFQYAAIDTRSWLLEVSIPLADINVIPTDGRIIGFDVAVNVVSNDSGSGRQGYYTTFTNTDPPILNASQYGNVELSECVSADINVTSVSLNKNTTTLCVGVNETLTATVLPANATNPAVTWSSSNTAIATVNASGQITAVAAGTATITVASAADGTKTATCVVTVNAVPAQPSTIIGNNNPVQGTTGLTYSVTNVPGVTYTWSVPAGWTITAGQNTNSIIVSVGASAGGGTISVTPSNTCGNGTAQALTVTTQPATVPVASVSLNKTTTTLCVGATETLTETVNPNDATNKNVNWSSDNTAVATVNASGQITAVSAGTATITVTTVDGNRTATCSVTVHSDIRQTENLFICQNDLPYIWRDTTFNVGTTSNVFTFNRRSSVGCDSIVTLNLTVNPIIQALPVSWTICQGDSIFFGRKYYRLEGIHRDTLSSQFGCDSIVTLNLTVNGAPAQPSIISGTTNALLGANGLTYSVTNVSGVNYAWSVPAGWTIVSGQGTNSITVNVSASAEAGDITVTPSSSCGTGTARTLAVTVQETAVDVTGVSLDKTNISFCVNAEEVLTATITPSNATNENVSWSSSNPSVATVDNTGKVTAVGVGTATITVTTEDGGYDASCEVTVKTRPTVATPAPTLTTLCVGDGIEVSEPTVNQNNGTLISAVWKLGGNIINPATYTVTLTNNNQQLVYEVTNECGTTTSTGVTITVNDVPAQPSVIDGPANPVFGSSVTYSATNVAGVEYEWSVPDGFTITAGQGTNSITVSVSESAISGSIIVIATNDCGNSPTRRFSVTPQENIINVTGISVNPTTLTFTVGDAPQTIMATITPNNATNQSVTWTSSNPAVATVVDGIVTPIGEGTAIITATSVDGGHQSTCNVTVNPDVVLVTSISVNPITMTFIMGGAPRTITPTITPNNATNQAVTWTSSNSAVASVVNGVVTPVGVGSATITATTVDGGHEAACAVTVSPADVPVTGITLNPTSMTFIVGDAARRITPTITPFNASNTNIIWTSSNPSVAGVSDGLVTPGIVGIATITATTEDGRFTATCFVTVQDIIVIPTTGISLNKNNMTIEVGVFDILIATVSPTFATNKTVTWTSSNNSVVTIDANGKLTAVGGGTATITARTADGHTATVQVTVVVPVTGINVEEKISIKVGDQYTLTPAFNPANATNRDVIYTIAGGSNIVSIDSNTGVITGLAGGEAKVRATSVNGGHTAICIVTVTDNGVGIGEVDEENAKSIIAYQNTIEINNLAAGEIISIYNLVGAKMYTFKASNSTEYITSLQPGMYIVVIEGTTVKEKVFIK